MCGPPCKVELIFTLSITEPGGAPTSGTLQPARRFVKARLTSSTAAKTYITSGGRADLLSPRSRPRRPGPLVFFADRGRQGHTAFVGHPQTRQDGLSIIVYRPIFVYRRARGPRQSDRQRELGFSRRSRRPSSRTRRHADQAYSSAQLCLDLNGRCGRKPRNLLQAFLCKTIRAEHAGRDGATRRRRTCSYTQSRRTKLEGGRP